LLMYDNNYCCPIKIKAMFIVTKLHNNFLSNFLNVMKRVFDVMKRVFDIMKGEYSIILAKFYVKLEAFNTAIAKKNPFF
jgi:hypothetical protein